MNVYLYVFKGDLLDPDDPEAANQHIINICT